MGLDRPRFRLAARLQLVAYRDDLSLVCRRRIQQGAENDFCVVLVKLFGGRGAFLTAAGSIKIAPDICSASELVSDSATPSSLRFRSFSFLVFGLVFRRSPFDDYQVAGLRISQATANPELLSPSKRIHRLFRKTDAKNSSNSVLSKRIFLVELVADFHPSP